MMGKTILMAGAAAVLVAMTAAPASAEAWWESTKISGRMYYDFSNINASSTATGGVKTDSTSNGTSFDIKRFYVGIDHKFNDIFSANITTDFTYDTTAGASQLYIKKAYLEANLSPMLDIRLGSTDLPWIPFAEGVYGYRYVENTLIDRTKFGTSADWGVHFKGAFANGVVDYAVSVVNGNGYKKPGMGLGTNRTDSVDVEGRVSAHLDDFVVAVGGYSGKLGAAHGTATSHTANRLDALAAYVGHGARIGVEYFNANDWNSVPTSKGTSDRDDGYSAFASYDFTPEWAVFGRYDWVNPKTTNSTTHLVTNDPKDNYFNVGIQYTPFKMVNLALVYKHDKADHGTLGTSNGTIGGSASGSYDEVGLFGNFQW
ncbi:MAG: hypothetical protein KGL26_10090 [Pseudomonadota bacterium]|nr:hypothetical protein [Pseudomonadota bacterium]